MSRILVVDDEPAIAWSLREILRDEGHEVTIASSAEEAVDSAAADKPDTIVLDVRLPGMDGLSAMSQLKKVSDSAPVIVMTAFGNLETAVGAVGGGAFEYLTKPFELDEALSAVRRALDLRERSGGESVSLVTKPDDLEIVGTSPQMQSIFRQVALVAGTSAPVLLTGESGTGKELAARAIHAHSGRSSGKFVAVSLPALDASRIERELFGEADVSSPRKKHRKGLLESADGGTVLLDEVGDIPPDLQVKLLRAIEQQEVVPVGATKPVAIDVRVLSATNRNLNGMMASGEFREDLFFRLSTVQITMPPLRDRAEDIPLLARHFVKLVKESCGISSAAMCELSGRPWPGNVRELRNAIENAAILARGGTIEVTHLPEARLQSGDRSLDTVENLRASVSAWVEGQLRSVDIDSTEASFYEDFLMAAEPALLETLLSKCGNNRTAAARLLGLHRATLRQKLNSYGLPREADS